MSDERKGTARYLAGGSAEETRHDDAESEAEREQFRFAPGNVDVLVGDRRYVPQAELDHERQLREEAERRVKVVRQRLDDILSFRVTEFAGGMGRDPSAMWAYWSNKLDIIFRKAVEARSLLDSTPS